MVEMIEQRLGKGWADWSLRGVALALIVSPGLIGLTLFLLVSGVVVGVWAWALNQADTTTFLIMVAAFVPLAVLYGITDLILGWQSRRHRKMVNDTFDRASAALEEQRDSLSDYERRIDRALTILEERYALLEEGSQGSSGRLET